MNSHRVHSMVEYIRRVGFDHDTQDLEDLSLQEILEQYGYGEELRSDEQALIRAEFERMAHANQTREVAQLVSYQTEVEPGTPAWWKHRR